jgi:hypothetical protein
MKILALTSTSLAALFAAGAAMAAPPLLLPDAAWGALATQNESYIEQVGDIHDAVVNQNGAANATSLIIQGRNTGQNDDDNDANVDQQLSIGAVSYVVQNDDDNNADVIQRGTNQLSGIVQQGDRNRATVTQYSTANAAVSAAAGSPSLTDPNGGLRAAAAAAVSAIGTTVANPGQTYADLHDYNGAALILQVGNRNEGTITQSGPMGTAVIETLGDRNDATITQNGDSDDAFILQHGDNNDATVTQNAFGNVAILYQAGNGNGATVTQNGAYAFSVNHQVGNFNDITVTQ